MSSPRLLPAFVVFGVALLSFGCGMGPGAGAGGCGEPPVDPVAEAAKKAAKTRPGGGGSGAAPAVADPASGPETDAADGGGGTAAGGPSSARPSPASSAKSGPRSADGDRAVPRNVDYRAGGPREYAGSPAGASPASLPGGGAPAGSPQGAGSYAGGGAQDRRPRPDGTQAPASSPAGAKPGSSSSGGSSSSKDQKPDAKKEEPLTSQGGCSPAPPPLSRINLGPLGGNGNRVKVDSTPIVCDRSYCDKVGFSNRGCCPLRPEGDPMRVVCERVALGASAPRWSFVGDGYAYPADENPFLAYAYGKGLVRACSNRNPVVCGTMAVDHGKAGESGQQAGGGPAPTSEGCVPVPPALSKINVNAHGGNGARVLADSTPIICDRAYCDAVGFVNRGCCPVRPEGDPLRVKCERFALGADAPRWDFVGSGSVEPREDNPFLALGYGTGAMRACSSKAPVVCGSLNVKNGVALGPGPASGGGGGTTPPATTPSQPPQTAPPATTPPASGGGSCALTVNPNGDNLRGKIGVRNQASVFLDATFEYFYGVTADGKPAGPCGRRWCDLGVDGGPTGVACANKLVGAPQWSGTGVTLQPGFQGNPYFAKVVDGKGTAKVCSQYYPQACGTAAVP